MGDDSIPRILVVDDQYGRDTVERDNFCKNADVLVEGGMERDNPVAMAAFCSGQVTFRGWVANDYEKVRQALGDDVSKWSLVLLDVRFDSNNRTDLGLSETDQDENFGEEIRNCLAQDFPNLPVVVLTVLQQNETDIPEDIPYLSKHSENLRRELTLRLLDYGRLNPRQKRKLLGLKCHEVGESCAFLTAIKDAHRYAESNVPILLLGETGVGKDVVVRYIHRLSKRSGKLITKWAPDESASTDAGTLFLDDIEVRDNLKIYNELLLQLNEIEDEKRPRLIAAALPSAELEAGVFPYDRLRNFFRLIITIPSLKDRRYEDHSNDIELLAEHLIGKWSRKFDKSGIRLNCEARKEFKNLDYPRNVWDLEDLILKLVLQKSSNAQISEYDIKNIDVHSTIKGG